MQNDKSIKKKEDINASIGEDEHGVAEPEIKQEHSSLHASDKSNEDNEAIKYEDEQLETILADEQSEAFPPQDNIDEILQISSDAKFKFQSIWLVYGLGALVMLYGAYNVFFGFSNPKSAQNKPVKTEQQHQLDSFKANERNLIPAESSLVSQEKEAGNKHRQSVDALSLSALNDNVVKMKTQLEAMTHSISAMEQDLKLTLQYQEKQNNKLEQFDKQLMQLSQKQDNSALVSEWKKTLEQQNKALEEVSNTVRSIQVNKAAITDPFRLTAITDQYAWLSDIQGRVFSLSEGETLKGYGKVLKIDQKAKKVYLSSGYVFQ